MWDVQQYSNACKCWCDGYQFQLFLHWSSCFVSLDIYYILLEKCCGNIILTYVSNYFHIYLNCGCFNILIFIRLRRYICKSVVCILIWFDIEWRSTKVSHWTNTVFLHFNCLSGGTEQNWNQFVQCTISKTMFLIQIVQS